MVTVTGSVSVSCECECGCIFCSWGVARYSRERGGLVVFRDGRRDKDDATSNICVSSDGGAFGGAVVVSIVVRVGAVTFVTTVTICCDNNVDAW